MDVRGRRPCDRNGSYTVHKHGKILYWYMIQRWSASHNPFEPRVTWPRAVSTFATNHPSLTTVKPMDAQSFVDTNVVRKTEPTRRIRRTVSKISYHQALGSSRRLPYHDQEEQTTTQTSLIVNVSLREPKGTYTAV